MQFTVQGIVGRNNERKSVKICPSDCTSRRRWNVENASDVWSVYTQRDGMREADPAYLILSAMAASGWQECSR